MGEGVGDAPTGVGVGVGVVAGGVVVGAGVAAAADAGGAGVADVITGGCRITVGVGEGGTAAGESARIPARVGASTGMGRSATAGTEEAVGSVAAGTLSVPGAACAGAAPGVPGAVVAPGRGVTRPLVPVGCVPDVAPVVSVAPGASWADDSLPKKGSSVAWLAVPTASSTAREPATMAIR